MAKAFNPTIVGTISPVALMLESGCTDAEIASALGIDLADVQRLPEMQSAQLGPVHASRTERSLYALSVGQACETTTRQMPDGSELVTRKQLAPDAAAAKAVLAALAPERWGQAAGDRVAVVVVRFPDQVMQPVIEGEMSSVLLSPPGK